MAVYGYARVSTDGQSLSAQLAELKAAKCEKIFQEKISGARSDRKQLMRLMGVLAKGDVLVVTRLDRLARSTRDLLNLLATIAEKGAGFKSLRDTWADTTTAHGRLMLTVLGGLAEFERELIRTRTGEGRERAKARGVVLGRKPKLSPHQRREALARREAGEVLTDIARTYNVISRSFNMITPHRHQARLFTGNTKIVAAVYLFRISDPTSPTGSTPNCAKRLGFNTKLLALRHFSRARVMFA